MRATRYFAKEDIRNVDDVAEAECGSGEVRVAPAYVGFCGTGLHEHLGGPTFAPVEPHLCSHETIPITLGYEFNGVITELGADVKGFTVGQQCVVQPTIACGTCHACEAGVESVCYNGGFIGLSGGGRGLSENVVVPEKAVRVLPSNTPLDSGALVEPLTLVLGGGPIGLAVVQCLKAKGVEKIIMSAFGVHHVLDPKTYDIVKISRELSGSSGPDVVFNCAGVPASIEIACTAVKVKGTVVNVAIWEKAVLVNPNMLVSREAKYTAVLGYQRKGFEAVVDHLAKGNMKPSKMIMSKMQIEDLVEGDIQALVND